MADIGIGIVGCAGRMGRMLVRQIDETAGATLAGGIEVEGNPTLGRDIGELAGIGANGLLAHDRQSRRKTVHAHIQKASHHRPHHKRHHPKQSVQRI